MTNSYDVGSPPPRSRRERLGRPSRNRLDAHTIWRGSPGLVATHDSLRAFLVLRSTVTWTLWGVALMSRPVFQRTKLIRRFLSSTAGGRETRLYSALSTSASVVGSARCGGTAARPPSSRWRT